MPRFADEITRHLRRATTAASRVSHARADFPDEQSLTLQHGLERWMIRLYGQIRSRSKPWHTLITLSEFRSFAGGIPRRLVALGSRDLLGGRTFLRQHLHNVLEDLVDTDLLHAPVVVAGGKPVVLGTDAGATTQRLP